MKRAVPFAGAAFLTCIAVACGTTSSAPPEDPAGSCRVIASACHFYDQGSGLAHDCHELGHAGDDVKCGPRKAECVSACPPREGGTTHPEDAQAPDGADGGADAPADGPDMCIAYCDCLAQSCSMVAGYPFSAPGSCAAQCVQMNTDQRACWPKWCQGASTSAIHDHYCEHAWGKYGLDECDTLP